MAISIFLSAFLLFQVQPLISNQLLPLYGGAPSVWITSMLFFQLLLLAGYAYTHWLESCLQRKYRRALHLLLLLFSLAFLPLSVVQLSAESRSVAPIYTILLSLCMSLGLPYFVLSTHAPFVQSLWAARNRSSPYRLYALSNTASFIALLSYPLVVQPWLDAFSQNFYWSLLYLSFVCAVVLVLFKESDARAVMQKEDLVWPQSKIVVLYWFLLSACGVFLFLGCTSYLTQDIASVPFLWIAPLAIYLLSLILCFESDRWYRERLYLRMVIASLVVLLITIVTPNYFKTATMLLLLLGMLFAASMLCHGELACRRPPSSGLTAFYLVLAAGGAFGGVGAALIVPLLYTNYIEFHLAVQAACFLAFLSRLQRQRKRISPKFTVLSVVILISFLLIEGFFLDRVTPLAGEVLAKSRNFFGSLRVIAEDTGDEEMARYSMLHGRILHGSQFTHAEYQNIPTGYYGRQSAAGLLLSAESSHSRRIAIVGLGTGTLAAYGKSGDLFRFFEINPQVIHYAQRYFSYLRDSAAMTETILGDGRLLLEKEPSEFYDVIVLDAFSGDGIPVHLLSLQAMMLYLSKLKRTGVLLYHISNNHFDLKHLVRAEADALGLESLYVPSPGRTPNATWDADYMVVGLSSAPKLNVLREHSYRFNQQNVSPWSDNYHNLLEVLR
ncbi:MAG: fused MFS/spermidine synthase [Bdellovibrionales bacterium]|nr:fused MFS/spermidine synthase [Bdellovibrionales bacterium]